MKKWIKRVQRIKIEKMLQDIRCRNTHMIFSTPIDVNATK